ncbi:MAG: chromate transporter [Firmicutes bacterium]|nr:chromate transporter [Bacillota bacterium]MBQ9972228.1 chromate transporter [Bacillota bacterium]
MDLLHLFMIFFKIGAFSFGGGYAMLPLIFKTVEDAGFMSTEELAMLVPLSQVTPGPIAVNAATYVGFNTAGIFGAAAATLGVGMPSFILILIVSSFLKKFSESNIIKGLFTGIRPVTAGLIASAVIVIGQTVLWTGTHLNPVPAAIFVVSFLLISKTKLSPIKITLLMAVVGAALPLLPPLSF